MSTNILKGNTNYRFDVVNQEINFAHGLEHRKVNGDMTYGNRYTKQHYNYLKITPGGKDNIHLVSMDNYAKNGYGMNTVESFIERYEAENPNIEVLAAVNADLCQIDNTGQTYNAYIKDYEVLVPGANTGMVSLVVDNEGKNYFKEVVHDGYEVIVYNKFNEIKYRESVTRINNINKTSELAVLLPNYAEKIDPDLNPIYINGLDLKISYGYTIYNHDYYSFAKGNVNLNSNQNSLTSSTFAIVNDQLSEIVEDGDKVVYQRKIKGFENIQSAISTNDVRGPLVVKGKVEPAIWDEAHPRTAFGVKENGDVFFMVVDGRDRLTPKHGVYLSELAELMYSYGAVDAYNYDGGGSCTLMLRNNVDEGTVRERFDVLNGMSDGNMRSIPNGFLVVKGESKAMPLDIRNIESRDTFETPTNLFVDENQNLHFDAVSNAERYEIIINNLVFETTKNVVPLAGLSLGDNEIKVRVKGTINNSTSNESTVLNYKINSNHINDLIELIKRI